MPQGVAADPGVQAEVGTMTGTEGGGGDLPVDVAGEADSMTAAVTVTRRETIIAAIRATGTKLPQTAQILVMGVIQIATDHSKKAASDLPKILCSL